MAYTKQKQLYVELYVYFIKLKINNNNKSFNKHDICNILNSLLSNLVTSSIAAKLKGNIK